MGCDGSGHGKREAQSEDLCPRKQRAPAQRRGAGQTAAVGGGAERAEMIPGFNLEVLLNELADKIAQRISQEQRSPGTASIKPRLLTVEQAAVYIGRSKASVQHMVSSGQLPTVRPDRRVFIDIADLDRWIEENKQAPVG